MKKIIILLLIFTLYLLPFTSASADYNESLTEYNTNFEKYRKSYADYISTKNSYLTYNTLNAQNEALTKSKTFLEVRADLLISYSLLLQEKLNMTPGIDTYDKNLKTGVITERVAFLQSHKSSIQAVSSLPDIVTKSQEVDNVKKALEDEANQIIGLILIGKVKDESNKISLSIGNISGFVNQIKSTGSDVTKLERWLLETKYKFDLAETKLRDAKVAFDQINSDYKYDSKKTYLDARNTVVEGNQYLKEAVFNAKEAVKEILSGPY